MKKLLILAPFVLGGCMVVPVAPPAPVYYYYTPVVPYCWGPTIYYHRHHRR
ncbi:MAG: hypothetical protein Q8L52_02045 [bacterium]|nr:hypothetical protein [bacterium]